MKSPVVSIVIPTHNRAGLLPLAIEAVIAQTFNDWRIVLVDDGSTDETPRVAARYAKTLGDRFLYLHQPNQGSSSARNRGIDACQSRFVAFLDSDDEFLPAKLERQLTLFDRIPSLGFVYSDYAFVNLNGVRHNSVFDQTYPAARRVPHETIEPGLCVCTGDLFDALIRGYFIATIVGMVRREALGESIRFPVGLSYAEEWLFYLKVAKRLSQPPDEPRDSARADAQNLNTPEVSSHAHRTGFVDEPLCLHHFTAGSLARSDAHRNNLGYVRLLRTILKTFGDLRDDQRSAVYDQLAHTHRQLRYDAVRSGRRFNALRHLACAWRYRSRTNRSDLRESIAPT